MEERSWKVSVEFETFKVIAAQNNRTRNGQATGADSRRVVK